MCTYFDRTLTGNFMVDHIDDKEIVVYKVLKYSGNLSILISPCQYTHISSGTMVSDATAKTAKEERKDKEIRHGFHVFLDENAANNWISWAGEWNCTDNSCEVIVKCYVNPKTVIGVGFNNNAKCAVFTRIRFDGEDLANAVKEAVELKQKAKKSEQE